MTATRWWVKLFARWQARVDSIKGQIQALSLGVTAYSTFSLLLQNSGHGQLVRPLGVVLALGVPIYAFYFFEGGVWNQVSRDRQDMNSDFASPSQLIGNELAVKGLAAALKERPLNEDEKEVIEDTLAETFEKRREGVLDDLNQ